jgi:3-phosphoshikimate 1-carboxyvinyltransferase
MTQNMMQSTTNKQRPAFLDLPPVKSASGHVVLPGSKSISNRVLLLSALCDGMTVVHDLLDADDTRVMWQALRQLGCGVQVNGRVAQIQGLSPQKLADLKQAHDETHPLAFFMGNAGTAMRPLVAVLAVLGIHATLHGVARMHQRPIADLVDALRVLGCSIDYLEETGYPPVRIRPSLLRESAPANTPYSPLVIPIKGDVSSQFLTALLMALPLVAKQRGQAVVIEVVGELISKPYVEITVNLLKRYGVSVIQAGWQRFEITPASSYQSPGQIYVEADASSASYFIALGALAEPDQEGMGIHIQGLGLDSIQGDIAFVEAARAMGAQIEAGPNELRVSRGAWPLKAIDLDCNAIPDAAMTLAVMALYADGPSTLRHIGSWRVKETDRIDAMATQCRQLGAQVETGPDWLRVHPVPPGQWRSASIHTYDDHRMAMCFSLAALNPADLGVRIEDPACVAKTFPTYFEVLFGVMLADPADIPVISIDGPSASGKGSLASRVAQALGYHYLDSGALYRALAWGARQQGIALDDEAALAELAAQLPVRFEHLAPAENTQSTKNTESTGLSHCVQWTEKGIEQDITLAIRAEEMGRIASRIAAYPRVREALVQCQRTFRQLPGLVTDGRDMGTVIFPDSRLKIFLTASVACRAQRRWAQLLALTRLTVNATTTEITTEITLDALCADLAARDAADASRPYAPLKPAQEAWLLDNSTLSLEDCLDQVLQAWQGFWPLSGA